MTWWDLGEKDMLVSIGVTPPPTTKQDAANYKAQKPMDAATRKDTAANNDKIATMTKRRRQWVWQRGAEADRTKTTTKRQQQ